MERRNEETAEPLHQGMAIGALLALVAPPE
jgi:hypothetical protein